MATPFIAILRASAPVGAQSRELVRSNVARLGGVVAGLAPPLAARGACRGDRG